jgi:L-lactate dehydrogenase
MLRERRMDFAQSNRWPRASVTMPGVPAGHRHSGVYNVVVAHTTRIGIVGLGRVGASAAISVLHSGIAAELLLHDAREETAQGEAMDLAHGMSFLPRAVVRHAGLDEMTTTDAVVIAAGKSGTASQSRLELAKENAAIVRGIACTLRGYGGLVVVVTNPVDVLTFEVARASGLPAERVLGTGTMLDTARLRHVVGRTLNVDAHSVHAQVVGEHGDSEVPLWSSAQAAGVPLRRWPEWITDNEQQLGDEVRRAAYEIIKRKGATNHAIGTVTAALLRTYLRDENRVLTVSRVQDGAAGLTDLALSLPSVVGTGGATRVLVPAMDDDEQGRLAHSADVLRGAIAAIAV